MKTAILRRVGRAVATWLLVALAAWACLEAAPGEPAEAAARAAGVLPVEPGTLTPSTRQRYVDETAARLGLAATPAARLGALAGGLVRGDLGRSWRDGRPVTVHLGEALPTTLGLLGASLVSAVLVGLGLALAGAHAATSLGRRAGRLVDGAFGALAAGALAVPPAWIAVMLLGVPGATTSSGAWLVALACLSYVAAALVARHGRVALEEARAHPAWLAARARGVSQGRALVVHALGLAGAPLAPLVGVLVPYLLGTALVVERAFDLHGLGALLLDAASRGDAPLVLGVTLVAAALVVGASLIADVLGVVLDPRRGRPGDEP